MALKILNTKNRGSRLQL